MMKSGPVTKVMKITHNVALTFLCALCGLCGEVRYYL